MRCLLLALLLATPPPQPLSPPGGERVAVGRVRDVTVSVSDFQDLRWRLIGPFRGGRVLAVSGIPGEPEHFNFGSVNGGVWETRDAGRTWQPIFDGQPIGSIGALAGAPSRPRTPSVRSGGGGRR